MARLIESGCTTWTVMERIRSLPKIRYCAVWSGIRICSSGLLNPAPAPFSDRRPMTSNGVPPSRMVWPIMAGPFELSSVGMAQPRTATRRRASSSPAVKSLPATMR
jgi:hypothetical protein